MILLMLDLNALDIYFFSPCFDFFGTFFISSWLTKTILIVIISLKNMFADAPTLKLLNVICGILTFMAWE